MSSPFKLMANDAVSRVCDFDTSLIPFVQARHQYFDNTGAVRRLLFPAPGSPATEWPAASRGRPMVRVGFSELMCVDDSRQCTRDARPASDRVHSVYVCDRSVDSGVLCFLDGPCLDLARPWTW